MATEIERRFVVTQSLDFLRGHNPQKIKQGYIHAQGRDKAKDKAKSKVKEDSLKAKEAAGGQDSVKESDAVAIAGDSDGDTEYKPGDRWYVHISTDVPNAALKTVSKSYGVLGVDFNADHLAVTTTNYHGNLLKKVTPEFEHDHALADCLELLEMCGKRVIHKQRYHVEHEGHVWHVDVFDKKLEGLVIAEIELKSANDAFVKPDWLGAEITFKKDLSNRSLAKQQRFPKKLKCRAK